jgi:serine/threonine protein kinase
MPFDGSNFKRLVKQISAGDYYEPKKPAEASTLIRIMLTVDPKKRGKVDDICVHPWINQGFDSNCLKSAEDLAQQTPVRLDVLLTLAPNNGINHSQAIPESSKEHKNQNESDSAINEPTKKQKLHGEAASSSGHKGQVPEMLSINKYYK